jgi:[acyl-carrier-protein] S-malonyltransferase
MQQAVPVGEGAMAALLGLDLDMAKEVVDEAAQGDVLVTANDNAPGQVVVSGKREAVERAVDVAKEKGAKRAMLLQVSAPFHCPMMAPAADVMTEALAAVELLPPILPLIANVTAAPVEDPAEIRRLLVEQVTGMVRWRECCMTMRAKGVEKLVEVGSGKVLSGLARRIDKELSASNVSTPAGVEEFLATL